jgi:hypothetical protein
VIARTGRSDDQVAISALSCGTYRLLIDARHQASTNARETSHHVADRPVRRSPRTRHFVRVVVAAGTAMLLLVSLAALSVTTPLGPPGRGSSVAARPAEQRSGIGRWLRRFRPRSETAAEPALADRPLAVPPPELELEVAAARERARAEAAAGRGDASADTANADGRPIWVRRMDQWSRSARSRREPAVAFDDGWDPPSAGSQPDSR